MEKQKIMSLIQTKKQFINKRTRQAIKKFEYDGLKNYEAYKQTKHIQIANGAAAVAAALTTTAAITLTNLYLYNS